MFKNKLLTICLGLQIILAHNIVQADPNKTDINSDKNGAIEYIKYCAECHGEDGRGNGINANNLSANPSDLTLLSQANGGSFPETKVYNIIDGRRVGDYHGQEMPIWGQIFKEVDGNENSVDEKIGSLIEYLKSIQKVESK